jgi:hypothetical protein
MIEGVSAEAVRCKTRNKTLVDPLIAISNAIKSDPFQGNVREASSRIAM